MPYLINKNRVALARAVFFSPHVFVEDFGMGASSELPNEEANGVTTE